MSIIIKAIYCLSEQLWYEGIVSQALLVKTKEPTSHPESQLLNDVECCIIYTSIKKKSRAHSVRHQIELSVTSYSVSVEYGHLMSEKGLESLSKGSPYLYGL